MLNRHFPKQNFVMFTFTITNANVIKIIYVKGHHVLENAKNGSGEVLMPPGNMLLPVPLGTIDLRYSKYHHVYDS